MVYKPPAGRKPRRPSTGEPVLSWQIPTDPESRWPAFGAAVVVIAGQAWMAMSLSLRPVWLFPVISAFLLLASVAVYLPKRTEPSRLMRALAVSLVGMLVIANAVSLFKLVSNIFVGESGLDPVGLLLVGIVLWVVNIAIFALVYWELDGDGPEARADGYRDFPDLVFPQQQSDQHGLAPANWKPTFPDYAYVSLTAATAFSPTDAMPYSKRVKLVMGVESTMSLAIVAMIVARAINIARG
ncbi:MAG TPA: hypothetical protein VHN12_14520 [Geobacteraceae bacterium]|nr:hypothetical protein [Geobacteraceae bacterium]